ncbi:uncharacterized protein B0J16DRAFT_363243 [Fusarium flagelliforme]|uniref:uncharacterized protein n=1 Tax=Fusarium flagelliforme TaxID=2675880 RepID=UPI001E8CF213|nr:uncharacterized protein B0J16DRAFT_363243 [Fusarium flagelliforme]KAH7186287.1 hypothetical protein B0J16DRAFT_363243 [Fusarium flagelliforme]
MAPKYTLLLPMKLDAFVFNGPVCDGVGADKAKIAPITQPNYTFLQLNDHLVQNDILDHVDLHASAPKKKNSRYVDIGKTSDGQPAVRQNRVGVYVHWSLPRPLRSGTTKPEKKGGNNKAESDARAPSYPAIPNRWLVIPPQKPPGMKPVTAWIIESDRTRNIDMIPASVDLEVDVAPFVTSFLRDDQTPGDISVEEQAEVFIGSCTEASAWDSFDRPRENEDQVNLTAASSSNQLFIDYQYHCGNVFSMLDTFSYQEKNGTVKHLESVVADYYVVGWHNDPSKDIMADLEGSKEQQPRSARLEAMRVGINKTVPEKQQEEINKWLETPEASRTLCHGSMYDVVWNRSEPPSKRPADVLAGTMSKWPLAVGTTPMDAVLTYIGKRDQTGDIEKKIWTLEALLRAAEDGVDAQIAAADESQAYNYAHLDGGDVYYLPAQEDKTQGADPPADLQLRLRQKNSAQVLLDATKRRLKQLRWDIFSWWWKLISDVDNDKKTRAMAKRTIHDVQDEIDSLVGMATFLQVFIDETVPPDEKDVKKGVMEPFHQRSDPTLVVGGVEAGWPKDFNDELAARVENQTIDLTGPPADDAYTKCMPQDIQPAGGRLVEEFFSLKNTAAKKDDRIIPLYHNKEQQSDKPDDADPWRDRWNESQPWFPLYVEWEAEYAHISYDHWKFTQRPAKKDTKGKITYVLKDDITMKGNQRYKDLRYVSGRSLILPQPAFSLRVHIERLFKTLSPEYLDSKMSEADRKDLLNKLDRLALLSLPLSGLTDHLLTRFQGSHVKPLVRQPGGKPVVLKEAIDVLPPPLEGRSPIDLSHIGEHSDPTPYGSLATLANAKVSGFKPVTHGQMRFIKINIVDKFGQAVHAIEPSVHLGNAVYPSISEFYDIDEVPGKKGKPNLVYDNRSTLEQPEYIQLPPSINQPTRLNAHYVVRDLDPNGADWRPATEFDKPIWGWVVVNYVDRALQFFLPNGDFYREVRSTSSDIKWLPFMEQAVPENNEQLDALIGSLTSDETRLKAFLDMVMSALSATIPAPTAYSQFMNSLVGRPLALANMGWSLELDANSLKNESTVPEQQEFPLDFGLLPGDGVGQYEFPIKFGDKTNNYDGLVGYFHAKASSETRTGGDKGDLNLDKIYTYFHSKYDLDGKPLAPIDTDSYPHLNTFWLNPFEHQPKTKDEVKAKAREYEAARNAKLQIFGAIFDPFAPITAFSSILPMRKLQLPSWTWETALKRITTFFHAGPLLLADKLPGFDASKCLDPKTYDVSNTPKDEQICLPALRAADWAWLQPYDLGNMGSQAYMPVDIAGESDEAPKSGTAGAE